MNNRMLRITHVCGRVVVGIAPHHRKIRAVFEKPCRARVAWFCWNGRVNVLAVTILVSSCLAGIFVISFAAEARRSRRSSLERDSLLPLDTPPAPAKRTHTH